MKVTVCDWTGETPASRYKLTREDGTVVMTVDLSEEAADELMRWISSNRKLEKVESVMKKE